MRLFESSASRARHCKRGCQFERPGSEQLSTAPSPRPFDKGGWQGDAGDAADPVIETCLLRMIDALNYVGLAELVAFFFWDPRLRNVRAAPRPNAHVEVFDGAVWIRRPRSAVMAELIRRGWCVLQAFWDDRRVRLIYDEHRPLHPDHEVSIDMALSSVALEVPAVCKVLRHNIGRAISVR